MNNIPSHEINELSSTDIEAISGGMLSWSMVGGALGAAGAGLGGLALIAAPEIALPLGIAAGVYGGFGAAVSMLPG
ncbi:MULTISPECIES: hypothetical protein [unclassified Asaia]|uniref:hypothetical protein n=1 Tax=unclassified Asaia TaxID=2685023 RepID=UPI0030176752